MFYLDFKKHLIFCIFFFFSSRRRHTRCSRDWSSDVCSSDLLRSSWLIRRAKVELAMKQTEEAKADLKEALQELNERLGRGATDPLLLADRGQTQELLGNKEEAKKDYEAARNKGDNDEWLRERLRLFKDAEDKKKAADEKKAAEEKKKEKKTDGADK